MLVKTSSNYVWNVSRHNPQAMLLTVTPCLEEEGRRFIDLGNRSNMP